MTEETYYAPVRALRGAIQYDGANASDCAKVTGTPMHLSGRVGDSLLSRTGAHIAQPGQWLWVFGDGHLEIHDEAPMIVTGHAYGSLAPGLGDEPLVVAGRFAQQATHQRAILSDGSMLPWEEVNGG